MACIAAEAKQKSLKLPEEELDMGTRTGTGKDRKSFRVYEWLDAKQISIKSIAAIAGVTPSTVSSTIRGKRNSRRVLQALIGLGCPEDILSLPEDLLAKEAA